MKVQVSDQLVSQAQKLSGLATKEAVVEKTLCLYIIIKSQNKLLQLWGYIKIYEDH